MKMFGKNKKQLITWRHWVVVGILMALMVGLAVFVYVADRVGVQQYTKPVMADTSQSETVTVQGEVTCLPHKGDGPSTQECAIGLRDTNGYFYGLKNTTIFDTGKMIEVEGTLTDASAEEKYDINGTIDVVKTSEL